MEAVRRLGSEKPVVIFSKSNCCISHAIKMLICSFGANPTVYELDYHPKGREIENALLALGSHTSVPAVFIGKLFVGGSNEVNYEPQCPGQVKAINAYQGQGYMGCDNHLQPFPSKQFSFGFFLPKRGC
ncbi:unnamed protein product [Coffea canephora]|uniref:Glutaredoxin domain-containing protein n=1 Tax=Coffea canephora TaxID=49390 RepID=A0A068UWV0_COFCA|nr:unnamed protein product [Coffea canephora]